MTDGLAASWSATLRHAHLAAEHFWGAVEQRCPGRLPQQEAAVFLAALGRLASGGDDPAGRAALLAVLGSAYRRYRLLPHQDAVEAALVATVARYAPGTPESAAAWAQAARSASVAVTHAAERAGDGPAWWPARVVDHDRAAEGVAILTVRPWRSLPLRPGQAVPVCTERWPGRWRWYSPANAPRPDGSVELHVRAVAAVSRALVHAVRPGDRLWLGPPNEVGLSLDPASRSDLLLVAGGTGLAPLRALAEQVAEAPAGRRVTLVVGARTFADLYDAISLDKLQCAHDWLTLVPAFSHDPGAEPGEWGDALTVALEHYRPGQEVYLCGPPLMVAGSRLRLLAAGVPAGRIHLPTEPAG
ncbi:FAD-binding oxidoreductase [Micromonospora yangpuensis]|uniref:NAD(P)H-flavin reductase n=1 Tax=Micromonospora yangpuensis TaxID=683228 RepID=A0A1C6V095_9ACTN|nr:FAD-binding oxidoreductase [Micromonospora yangpuensis]GGL96813.1 oxidoreductase [Micromonospora yangpuensis]SCL59735.1 NAD(P)H-flavin reductase [Micromonospora yangpuensis]